MIFCLGATCVCQSAVGVNMCSLTYEAMFDVTASCAVSWWICQVKARLSHVSSQAPHEECEPQCCPSDDLSKCCLGIILASLCVLNYNGFILECKTRTHIQPLLIWGFQLHRPWCIVSEKKRIKQNRAKSINFELSLFTHSACIGTFSFAVVSVSAWRSCNVWAIGSNLIVGEIILVMAKWSFMSHCLYFLGPLWHSLFNKGLKPNCIAIPWALFITPRAPSRGPSKYNCWSMKLHWDNPTGSNTAPLAFWPTEHEGWGTQTTSSLGF